jgi:hypothetical protein
VGVIETGSGNDELMLAIEVPMRRRMSRPLLSSPMLDDLSALFGYHLTVVIHKKQAFKVPTLVGS